MEILLHQRCIERSNPDEDIFELVDVREWFLVKDTNTDARLKMGFDCSGL